MVKLQPEQIVTVALGAELPKTEVATAVAIALTESGGDARAYNPRGLDNSYGLWQINMRGDLGPDRRKKLGLTSNEQLFDPATNARAMMLISGGGKDWTPWTTFTSGRYLLYVGQANKASADAGLDTGGILDLTPDFGPVTKALSFLTHSQNWIRIGIFVAGFVLLMYSLTKLTGASQTVNAVKSTVRDAVV